MKLACSLTLSLPGNILYADSVTPYQFVHRSLNCKIGSHNGSHCADAQADHELHCPHFLADNNFVACGRIRAYQLWGKDIAVWSLILHDIQVCLLEVRSSPVRLSGLWARIARNSGTSKKASIC